jgi:hypothetical protein
MQLTLTIETGEPSGKTFRLVTGITIPVMLVALVLIAFGLI